jgi:hypothetical protein
LEVPSLSNRLAAGRVPGHFLGMYVVIEAAATIRETCETGAEHRLGWN